MKKAMFGLEKTVEIIILIVFAVIVILYLYGPTGALEKVTEKANYFKQFIPSRDSSVGKPDIKVAEDVNPSFDSLAKALEDGKSNRNDNCLIYSLNPPNIGSWKFKLLYLPETKSTSLRVINPEGQVLKTKTIDGLTPCFIGGKYQDTYPAINFVNSHITAIKQSQEKEYLESTSLEITGNKIIKSGEEAYSFDTDIHGSELALKDGSEIMLFYKFDKDHICFITTSTVGSKESVPVNLLADIVPSGRSPLNLCYQDESNFIKDCSVIKNKDKCFSYTQLSPKCNWDTDLVDECESCKDIDSEKCKGYDNPESCEIDICRFGEQSKCKWDSERWFNQCQ